MWTCVHTGDMEPQVWMDSKLIVCLSNVYSGTRTAYLSRGIDTAASRPNPVLPYTTQSYYVYGLV